MGCAHAGWQRSDSWGPSEMLCRVFPGSAPQNREEGGGLSPGVVGLLPGTLRLPCTWAGTPGDRELPQAVA